MPINSGEKNGNHTLTQNQIDLIMTYYNDYKEHKVKSGDIAINIGLTIEQASSVRMVLNGYTWSWYTGIKRGKKE